MSTDQRSPARPAAPPAPDAAAHQEAALFEALLHRVRASADKAHLKERTEAALRLILNRPEDQALRIELTAQIGRIVALLPDGPPSDPTALAKAIDICLRLLDGAEKRRIAEASAPAAAPARRSTAMDSVVAYDRPGTSHPPAAPAKPSPRTAVLLIAALLVILGAGLAIGLHGRGDGKGEPAVRPLVQQIEAAARGTIPPSNIFGGGLRVTVDGGRVVVIASGIPAGECVLAGWDLVHKGILSVNGTTPNRVSAAKLNELCHEEDTATLMWTPKPGNQ